MRISDWSSDVCSSDLRRTVVARNYGIAAALQKAVGQILSPRAECLVGRQPPGGDPVPYPVEGGENSAMVAIHRKGGDRKRVVKGKSVTVRVECGGRRILKTENTKQ